MYANELVEDFCESSTAGESHGTGTDLTLSLTYGGGNLEGYLDGSFLRSGIDIGGQFLEASEHGALNVTARTIISRRYAVKGDL